MKGRRTLVAMALAASLAACESRTPEPAPPQGVMRCGWFDNPSPGNAWLYDAEGDWTIAMQGGHQAQGDWPRFPDPEWVLTGHGSVGYGCACLLVLADPASHQVTTIQSATAKPLAECRGNPALQAREPANPLEP